MQDLGVCDEVECFEDVNIPDVDLTFTSFEDLFASDNDHPSTNIEVSTLLHHVFFLCLHHLSIFICTSNLTLLLLKSRVCNRKIAWKCTRIIAKLPSVAIMTF